MQVTQQKWMAVAGVVGSVGILLACLITGLVYRGRIEQPYSLFNHFVSELGEVGVSEWAWLFNGALIIGGICIVISFIGLALQFKGWFRYLILVMGLITGIAGTLVGVFPMNQLSVHITVALTFFNTGWMITGVFSVYILIVKGHRFPRWLAIPGIVTAIAFIAFSNYNDPFMVSTESLAEVLGSARPAIWGLALLEWVVVLTVLIWVGLVSAVMYRFDDVSIS